MDRVLACQLGSAAVEALLEGKRNLMVGVVNQKIKLTDFSLSLVRKRKINSELLKFF
jgi:6-phosphofructokinase 1